LKVLSFILVVLGVFWAQKAKNFEAWLERIEDRCDKASNKLQVIERHCRGSTRTSRGT